MKTPLALLFLALAPCSFGQAEEATPPPPAVIVDVDETVLDNHAYQARLVLDAAPVLDVAVFTGDLARGGQSPCK